MGGGEGGGWMRALQKLPGLKRLKKLFYDTLDYRMSYFSHIVIDLVVSIAFYWSSSGDDVYSISITINVNTVVACNWSIKGIDNAGIPLFMFHYFRTIYHYLPMISFV